MKIEESVDMHLPHTVGSQILAVQMEAGFHKTLAENNTHPAFKMLLLLHLDMRKLSKEDSVIRPLALTRAVDRLKEDLIQGLLLSTTLQAIKA